MYLRRLLMHGAPASMWSCSACARAKPIASSRCRSAERRARERALLFGRGRLTHCDRIRCRKRILEGVIEFFFALAALFLFGLGIRGILILGLAVGCVSHGRDPSVAGGKSFDRRKVPLRRYGNTSARRAFTSAGLFERRFQTMRAVGMA